MKNDNVLNRIAAAQKLLMQTNADLKMVETIEHSHYSSFFGRNQP
jgi:hypothetical protein